MLDGRGRALPGPSYDQVPVIFSPANNDHPRTVWVWVPYPPRRGRFWVTFALGPLHQQPLNSARVQFGSTST
jgi:hypothetical protein